MKTIPEIMRIIISGIMPHSDIGICMELMAYAMTYDGRF